MYTDLLGGVYLSAGLCQTEYGSQMWWEKMQRLAGLVIISRENTNLDTPPWNFYPAIKDPDKFKQGPHT